MNQQILLQRVRERLPEEARIRLQVATYDETIRFNVLLVDDEVGVVQPYLSTARGVESPTFLLRRRTPTPGPVRRVRADLRLADRAEHASMTSLLDLLPIAHQAANGRRAARTRPPGALTPKGDRDRVEVDFTIERLVRDFLAERTPNIAFVERRKNGTGVDASEWWTLDPIDGTVNFAHDVPLFAVSLALIRDQRPVLGVMTFPRWTAATGQRRAMAPTGTAER